MGASHSEPVSELVPLHSGNSKTGASLEGLEVGTRSHTSYGGRLQEESYHRSDWKEWWETKLRSWFGPEPITLILSVVGLMVATATERMTFKMSVDRMTPFRVTLILMTISVSFLVYSVVASIKLRFTTKITPRMMEFPHKKLFMMAVVDTLSLSGLILSAAAMTPTMTVILLHISTPFVVLGSKWNFPTREYSVSQLRGVYLITLAVVISIVRHVVDLVVGVNVGYALSSIFYVAAAALHGLGTVMKEKAIVEWSQPLDIHYISSWLFFYQIIVAFLLSPILYLLQGLSDGFRGLSFPISSMLENISDGVQCFLGSDPPISQHSDYDASDCECEFSYVLVFLYVISNVVVLECIGRVLQTGNKVLGYAMAAAVLFAFVALGLYDSKVDADHAYDRVVGSIGISDFISIGLLLLGINFHHSDSEQADEHPTSM